MTNEELADIRAYVAERAAARARGEHVDSDERREAALLDELEEVMGDLYQLADRAERVWREMGYHTAAISQSGRSSLDALRAALDATPEETRAQVGARERALADLDVMKRERDEARRELLDLDLVLPAACGSRVDAAKQLEAERDEARAALRTWETWDAEHHGGVRAYVAALEADQRRLVVAEQDAAQARADLDEARAQLAALHAAAVAHVRQWHAGDTEIGACDERLDATLADLATAAAEHERSVRADERAKALREAADVCERLSEAVLALADGGDEDEAREMSAEWLASTASDLRAMADEAERGTR